MHYQSKLLISTLADTNHICLQRYTVWCSLNFSSHTSQYWTATGKSIKTAVRTASDLKIRMQHNISTALQCWFHGAWTHFWVKLRLGTEPVPSTTRRHETHHQIYFGQHHVYGLWIFLYPWQVARKAKHDIWATWWIKKAHDIPQNHYQSSIKLFPAKQKERFQEKCAAICGRTTTSCQALWNESHDRPTPLSSGRWAK